MVKNNHVRVYKSEENLPREKQLAHKIAVVDGRLPFELAYCLSLLVFDHAGGPIEPERTGPMSLTLLKQLSAQDLVFVTAEMISPARAVVRLTATPAIVDEMVDIPASTVVVTYYDVARRKKKANWFVEVTQQGLDLVAGALAPTD